jgi:predicted nucleic acid-binding protein
VAPASYPPGLIDTDILIDATHNIAEAITFLRTQRRTSGLQISIVSTMEMIVGCRDRAELNQVQQFLWRVTVLPVNQRVSQTACQLMESFYLSHGLLIPDALIAATAMEDGVVLYTRNVRHFSDDSSIDSHSAVLDGHSCGAVDAIFLRILARRKSCNKASWARWHFRSHAGERPTTTISCPSRRFAFDNR